MRFLSLPGLIVLASVFVGVVRGAGEAVDEEYMIRKSDLIERSTSDLFHIDAPAGQLPDDGVLQDWIPIRATIGVNDSLEYSFHVNYSSRGLSSSYQIMIFISASLCALPPDWSIDDYDDYTSPNGLTLYYTFNRSITNLTEMRRIPFINGYAQGIASTNISTIDGDSSQDHQSVQNLYITIKPDQCTRCQLNYTWVYELGLSQSDLTFQYDLGTSVELADTDSESVAFSASNITFKNDSTFTLNLYDRSLFSRLDLLNQSWCAFEDYQGHVRSMTLNQSNLSETGNFFAVDGLNQSSDYTGVLLQSFDNAPYGGAVYKMFNFTTTSSQACKVIYGLDFCTEVAYAVPVSSNFSDGSQTLQELAEIYDNRASQLYQQFDYAMRQIDCDAHLDTTFSPIRTCADCESSYRQWLCSVTIPRCSSDSRQGYARYDRMNGRNSFIRDTIQPPMDYYEILPCIDVCYSIVRDCPPDFGFSCPSKARSYGGSYEDPSKDYVRCNAFDLD